MRYVWRASHSSQRTQVVFLTCRSLAFPLQASGSLSEGTACGAPRGRTAQATSVCGEIDYRGP